MKKEKVVSTIECIIEMAAKERLEYIKMNDQVSAMYCSGKITSLKTALSLIINMD